MAAVAAVTNPRNKAVRVTEPIGDLASALPIYRFVRQYLTIEAKLLKNRHQGGKSKTNANPQLRRVSPIWSVKATASGPRRKPDPTLRQTNPAVRLALQIGPLSLAASTDKWHAWPSRAPQCSDHRSNRERLAPRSRGKNPKIAAGRTYAIGSLQDAGDDARSIFLAEDRACIVISIRAYVQHGPDDDCSGQQFLPGRYTALWSVIGDLRASG